jgi:hypothetical protein
MNGDNSASSVLLKCVKCGQLYQSIAGPSNPRRCVCGGALYARVKLEPEKPKELPK